MHEKFLIIDDGFQPTWRFVVFKSWAYIVHTRCGHNYARNWKTPTPCTINCNQMGWGLFECCLPTWSQLGNVRSFRCRELGGNIQRHSKSPQPIWLQYTPKWLNSPLATTIFSVYHRGFPGSYGREESRGILRCNIATQSSLTVYSCDTPFRFIVLRRVLVIIGSVYILRCFLLTSTSLSIPSTDIPCDPKVSSLSNRSFDDSIWNNLKKTFCKLSSTHSCEPFLCSCEFFAPIFLWIDKC